MNLFEQTYTAVLKSKANEYKGTYDGKYHRLIESVEGTDPNNKDVVVEYSVSEKKEESSWSREVPKGVNAGSYPVYIRIDRDNDGKFEETIDAIATIDPVSIELKNISDEIPESVIYEEARNRTYDYSVIKTEEEIELLRENNLLVSRTLAEVGRHIAPGVTTKELDTLAEDFIRSHGAVPAFLGYQGFPASLCISINEEVVHGIPSSKRVLREGDIVSVDCGTL